MSLGEFRQSLTAPPAGLMHALAGLWWDAKGDWTRAHESAQQDEGVEGSWVHGLMKSGVAQRILFLVDRRVLARWGY